MHQLGHTPLIIASCKGHAAVVKLLLEAGADLNILSPMVSELYGFVSRYNYLDIHNTFFSNVSSICLPRSAVSFLIWTQRRYTALMTATEQGHTAVVKLLLEAGADTSVLSPMVNLMHAWQK